VRGAEEGDFHFDQEQKVQKERVARVFDLRPLPAMHSYFRVDPTYLLESNPYTTEHIFSSKSSHLYTLTMGGLYLDGELVGTTLCLYPHLSQSSEPRCLGERVVAIIHPCVRFRHLSTKPYKGTVSQPSLTTTIQSPRTTPSWLPYLLCRLRCN